MCSRLDQNNEVVTALLRFSAKAKASNKSLLPRIKFNIGIGQPAFILRHADEQPIFEESIFGFVPGWAKEVKKLYFNARTEGDYNPDNTKGYTGQMGIFNKPAFREAIAQHRCIVPISAFYEGPEKEKLKNPFRLESPSHPVLFLAGIYSLHLDPSSKQILSRFAVLTTPANEATMSIGHHRCPLMLADTKLEEWLNPKTSTESLLLHLQTPWQPNDMRTFAIDPQAIKNTYSDTAPAERHELLLF